MECEVCGRQIYGKGWDVIIEGAKLMVCSECTQFSTSTAKIYTDQKKITNKRTSAPKTRQQQAVRGKKAISEDLELLEKYSQLVRAGREIMQLTHDELSKKIGEKVSVLKKIETGKMVPNIDLAKKLESALKIKLLQPVSRVPIEEKFTKKSLELTLGDIILMYDKKGNKVEE